MVLALSCVTESVFHDELLSDLIYILATFVDIDIRLLTVCNWTGQTTPCKSSSFLAIPVQTLSVFVSVISFCDCGVFIAIEAIESAYFGLSIEVVIGLTSLFFLLFNFPINNKTRSTEVIVRRMYIVLFFKALVIVFLSYGYCFFYVLEQNTTLPAL